VKFVIWVVLQSVKMLGGRNTGTVHCCNDCEMRWILCMSCLAFVVAVLEEYSRNHQASEIRLSRTMNISRMSSLTVTKRFQSLEKVFHSMILNLLQLVIVYNCTSFYFRMILNLLQLVIVYNCTSFYFSMKHCALCIVLKVAVTSYSIMSQTNVLQPFD